MLKPNEGTDRMIEHLAGQLMDYLIDGITEILKDEDYVDLDLRIGNTLFTTVNIDNENEDNLSIEFCYEYTDNEDGLIYSECSDINDMGIGDLMEIYAELRSETR